MCLADLLSRDYMLENFPEEFNTVGMVHCVNRFNNNNVCNIKTEFKVSPVLNKIIKNYY